MSKADESKQEKPAFISREEGAKLRAQRRRKELPSDKYDQSTYWSQCVNQK